MRDLLWDDVKVWFDLELNGTLSDAYVPDTTGADWQAVVDLVQAEGWDYAYVSDGEPYELPAPLEEVLNAREEAGFQLNVWPAPGFLATFRPYSPEQIDFAIPLEQLQGQEDLRVLCQFLRALGQRLNKPVLMTPEDDGNRTFLKYDVAADRVLLLDAS